MITKIQIQDKFKDLPIDRIRLYISALTELLYSKLIEDNLNLSKENEQLKEEREHFKICFESTDINAKKIKTKLFNKEELCKKYRQALQEISGVVDKNISFMDTSSTTKAMIRIQAKINEVIGAE